MVKLHRSKAAPQGAPDTAPFTARMNACPDTNLNHATFGYTELGTFGCS
jgi:hypothetical protein